MAGKPQRRERKIAVQFYVHKAAYERVLPLIRGDEPLHMSFSRLLEAILLLAKNEYVSNTSRDFIAELCLMKRYQIEEAVALKAPTPQRRVHVTIDPEALGFLDMIVARYHAEFRTRGMAVSLILRRFSTRLTTQEKTDWMKRRIEEILLKYPVRY